MSVDAATRTSPAAATAATAMDAMQALLDRLVAHNAAGVATAVATTHAAANGAIATTARPTPRAAAAWESQTASEPINLVDSDDDVDQVYQLWTAPSARKPPALSPARLARKRQRLHAAPSSATTHAISLLDDDDRKPAAVSKATSAVAAAAAVDLTVANSIVTLDDSHHSVDRVAPAARRVRLKSAPHAEPPPPPNAEWQVLTVFPDADVNFVRASLLRHGDNAAAVVNEMSELQTYPKTAATIPTVGSASVIVHMDPQLSAASKLDYMSMESFVPNGHYFEQARHVLLHDFCFLSHKGAMTCLQRYKYHYAVCHDKLLQAVKGTVVSQDEDGILNVPYDRVVTMMKGGRLGTALAADQIQSILVAAGLPTHSNPSKLLLKNPRPRATKPLVTDPTLADEIVYVRAKLTQWMDAQQTQRDCARQKVQAQQDGSAWECPCCYDSYPVDQMIQCQEGHLFCHSCLVSYTSNLVFGNDNLGVHKTTKKLSLELQCLNGDCASHFDRQYLACSLTAQLLHQYDTIQLKLSIQSAGLGDTVCACPKCDFVMDVPPGQGLLHCPVATCQYVSCRECGEAAHIPLRCDEVEKANVTKGRLAVEEAITAAKIRKCPSCKKAFIKSDGCNKITCGCGTKSCYICQKPIKDYTHFCQVPHCTHQTNCLKCPLYTQNADEDDAAAMRAAAYTTLQRVTQDLSAVAPDGGNAQIDIESILNAK